MTTLPSMPRHHPYLTESEPSLSRYPSPGTTTPFVHNATASREFPCHTSDLPAPAGAMWLGVVTGHCVVRATTLRSRLTSASRACRSLPDVRASRSDFASLVFRLVTWRFNAASCWRSGSPAVAGTATATTRATHPPATTAFTIGREFYIAFSGGSAGGPAKPFAAPACSRRTSDARGLQLGREARVVEFAIVEQHVRVRVSRH